MAFSPWPAGQAVFRSSGSDLRGWWAAFSGDSPRSFGVKDLGAALCRIPAMPPWFPREVEAFSIPRGACPLTRPLSSLRLLTPP